MQRHKDPITKMWHTLYNLPDVKHLYEYLSLDECTTKKLNIHQIY